MNFIKTTINKTYLITENTLGIDIDIPLEQKNNFHFKAGQYITLQTTINQQKERRPYSIFNAPSENKISVAIKKIEKGVFSNFAFETFKENTEIEISFPEGNFIYEPYFQGNIVLFSVGSGITPIFSILKTILLETQHKVLLIFGNKTPETTLFLKEIQTLQQTFSERFFIQYIYSQSYEKNTLFGRMDPTIIRHLLQRKFSHLNFEHFYICGMPKMTSMVKNTLLEMQISSEKIKTELFVNQEDNQEILQGKSILKVIQYRNEEIFEIDRNKPILTSLLERNLEVPYSCRGGICSSCMCRITHGKAQMIKNQILSQQEIEEGLVLLCQAHPISDKITINYDEI